MANRSPNTNGRGSTFDPATVEAVWKKATIIPGVDTRLRRRDICGATIDRWNYGKTVTTGWEVDHICPVSKGGSDDIINLEPLQWENNRCKGDHYPPGAFCIVRF